jgi:predicted nuclease with TOPRIM domain
MDTPHEFIANSSPLSIMEHEQMRKGGNIREQILARLEELKQEFETGQAELDKVEKQRTYLREKMLQISGAVQVLQELLAQEQSGEQQNGSGPNEVWSEPTETRQYSVRNRDADQANQ